VTVWRRRKKADKGIALPTTGASSHPDRNGRSRGVKGGRHLALIERANDADFIQFACAVVGELVETGQARLGNLKSFPRINGGPYAGESMAVYQARRNSEIYNITNPVPVWRDCPSPQKEAIMSCRAFPPVILSIAAADLGQFVYLRKAGAKKEAETAKGIIYIRRYYHGHTARRESSQSSSVHAAMKSQGIDISRRMVCHYRKSPYLDEAREWLRQLIGHRISRVPATNGALDLREDLSSAALIILKEAHKKEPIVNIDRVGRKPDRPKILPDTQSLWIDQTELRDWETSRYALADDIDLRNGWKEPV